MPKINLYTSDVNRGINPALSNQAIQASENAARANADGMRSLAQGLQNLAQGIEVYSRAKRSIDDSLFLNEAKNEAERSALEANDLALRNPDAKPDGSDIYDNFENEYDLAFENYSDGLDDDQLAKAKIIWDDQKNNFREKLFQQQREMHGKFISNKSDEIKNTIALSAFQDPTTMGQGIIRMGALYDEMSSNGLINQAQNQSLKKMAAEEIAIQSIQGDIRKRNFDEAQERLITGDASTFLSADNRLKLLDIIDREKLQAIDADLKIDKQKRDQLEDQKKTQSEAIFTKTLSKLSVATSPAQKEAVYQEMLNLRVAGLISDEQFKFTDSVIQNTKGNYNEALEFKFRDQILRSNINFDSIQNQIVDAVNKNSLDAKTGTELLSALKVRKDQVESDPAVKARHSLAEGRLDAAFGKDTFFEPMDQPRKIAKQNAIEHMYKRISEGADPFDAAAEGIKLFGKSVNALPLIPGVDFRIQSDPNGLDAAKQQLIQKYKAGQISKDEYAKAIKIWMQRSQTIKSEIDLQQSLQPKNTEGQ